MLNFLKKIFKKNNEHLQFGSTFGVLHGQFVGELFVYIEEQDNVLYFLSVPNMKTREVPREKYEYGLKSGVIEYVERLPRNERMVCKAQFQKNKTETNEQQTTN